MSWLLFLRGMTCHDWVRKLYIGDCSLDHTVAPTSVAQRVGIHFYISSLILQNKSSTSSLDLPGPLSVSRQCIKSQTNFYDLQL
jgi:hypothetical protein